MKLYGDPRISVFFIETVTEGPFTDFVASLNGDLVSIYRPARGYYELRNVHYSNLQDYNGNNFQSAQAAVDYVTNQCVLPPGLSAVFPLSLDVMRNELSLNVEYVTDGGSI